MEMAAYPAYDNYKDSCVEWIGVIPDHWEVRRSKFLFSQSKELARSNDIQLSATQSHGVIPQAEYQDMVGRRVTQIQTNLEKRKHVEIDDFVISMRSFQGGIERAKAAGCIRSSYIILKPGPKIHPAFYAYVLKAPRYIQALQITGHFIRDGQDLNFENFSAVDLFVIPVLEQRAIAAFLDEKCAGVDEAVRIKEQEIVLLRERRQILIQHAVTRGLNPNAPMKDSGIDWIGKIPAHWNVRRNFTLFRESKRSGNANLPVLSVSIHSGVSTEELSEEENIRSAIKIEDRTSYKEVLPGFVAYNMMRAWQGGIGSVSVHGMVSPAYVVAEPIAEVDASFFELLYRTPVYIWQMDAASKGITDFRKRLYWDDFRNLVTILPPMDEQHQIIQSITAMTTKINSGITIKERQVAALKEYKTSLINAAVTGKIKVI